MKTCIIEELFVSKCLTFAKQILNKYTTNKGDVIFTVINITKSWVLNYKTFFLKPKFNIQWDIIIYWFSNVLERVLRLQSTNLFVFKKRITLN